MPAPTAADRALVDMLVYLDENRQSYSLDERRTHLLTQGHDPSLVDQAIAEHQAVRGNLAKPAWPLGLPVGLGTLILIPYHGLGVALILAELGLWLALRETDRERLARSFRFGAVFAIVAAGLAFVGRYYLLRGL